MPYEYIYLKGKGAWCRPNRLNEWGSWSMVLYPDEESLTTLRALQEAGLKNHIKKDDDGWFIRLSRKSEIRLRSGAIKGLRPPHVFDGTKPLPGGGFAPLADNVLIGNGSEVVVKVEVYSFHMPSPGSRNTKSGKAIRWDSVRIDKLNEYSEKDIYKNELETVRSFDDAAAAPRQGDLW